MHKLNKIDILLVRLDILLIEDTSDILCSKAMQLYDETFPDWEKEPIDIILEKIKTGKTLLVIATTENKKEVFSMALLEKHTFTDSILFTYLSVKENLRGLGIGSKMVLTIQNMIKEFFNVKWLLIEAEQRQAELYSRLNFLKLSFNYISPSFVNDTDYTFMHLMVYDMHHDKKFYIKRSIIEKFIKEIFIYGYLLKKDDERIKIQFDFLKKNKIKARKLKSKDRIDDDEE